MRFRKDSGENKVPKEKAQCLHRALYEIMVFPRRFERLIYGLKNSCFVKLERKVKNELIGLWECMDGAKGSSSF